MRGSVEPPLPPIDHKRRSFYEIVSTEYCLSASDARLCRGADNLRRHRPSGGRRLYEHRRTVSTPSVHREPDIWETRDEFRFVYATLKGDGEVTARVDSLTALTPWTKAGVMIRGLLGAGARNAFTMISASNGVDFQYRLKSGAATGPGGKVDKVTRVPYWLRVRRVGNVFTGYVSADGQSWRQHGISVTLAIGETAYAGLAATSQLDGTLATAVFSNVTIAPVGGTPGAYEYAAEHQRNADDDEHCWRRLRIHANRHRSRWQHTHVQHREPADLGDLQHEHRSSLGDADERERRDLLGHPDQRQRRSGVGDPAGVCARGERGTESCAGDLGACRAQSVTVGTAYAFQPTASDPDGDPLTYWVTNAPAWATFTTATGRLARHAGGRQRGDVQQHRDQSQRQQGRYGAVAGVRDRGQCHGSHQSRSGDLGDAADISPAGHSVFVSANVQPMRTAIR